MSFLLYSLFILLSLGQLQRLSFFNFQINGYIHELLMLTFIFFCFYKLASKKQDILSIFSKQKSITIFIATLCISFLLTLPNYLLTQNSIGFLYLFRIILIFTFYICVDWWASQKKENIALITRGIILFTILTITFSLVQYFWYPNLRNLFYLGWDPHWYRVFGTFFDTSITTALLLICFFWSLYRDKTPRNLSLLICLGIVLLFTYSRGAYISFIVGMMYFFYIKKKLSYLLGVISLFSVLIIFLPRPAGESVRLERMFSIESRLRDNREGINLFLKNPVFGVGYNRIGFNRIIKTQSNVPNHAQFSFSSTYITLLAASGVVGLFGFIYFFIDTYNKNSQTVKTILITLGVFSLFDNVFLNTFVLAIFLLALVRQKITPRVQT